MSDLNFVLFLAIGLIATWISHYIVMTQKNGNWLGLVIISSSTAILWISGPNSFAFGALIGSGWAFLNEASEAALIRWP